jgi:hypothetical protein
MAITINGTTGISGVDGSAGTPALQGSDPNTGIYSPGADQVAVATGGVERLSISSAGEVTTTNQKINLVTVGRGAGALFTNVALGDGVLAGNTTGLYNTAIGTSALSANTTGNNNSAIGISALLSNTIGINNAAAGADALRSNSAGNNNSAFGVSALYNNTTGSSNTCVGQQAGLLLTTGSNNTIIGNILGTAGLADTVIIGAGTTERLRIDSSGRVGIGTSSPAYKCDIDVTGSALRLNSTTTGAALVISSDDAANAKIEFGDESDNDRGAITYDNPNNALIFQANAAERLRIANTGAFGLSGANYGTSGQVLTSQGSGSAPQWVSAGYTSLGRTNTTSGASHTVTGIPTTARHVVIVFSNISVNTANTPQLTFQVGNGSLSTGDYYWSIAYGTNFQALNATSSVRVFHTDFNSPSNSYFGVIEIYPTDPYIIGYIQATVQGNQPSRGSFKWAGSSAIDRVNLSTASTFDAGHFVVYYI